MHADVRLSICPSLSTAPGIHQWMNPIRYNTLEIKCQHTGVLQLWLSLFGALLSDEARLILSMDLTSESFNRERRFPPLCAVT